jgi:hypothetical protein
MGFSNDGVVGGFWYQGDWIFNWFWVWKLGWSRVSFRGGLELFFCLRGAWWRVFGIFSGGIRVRGVFGLWGLRGGLLLGWSWVYWNINVIRWELIDFVIEIDFWSNGNCDWFMVGRYIVYLIRFDGWLWVVIWIF